MRTKRAVPSGMRAGAACRRRARRAGGRWSRRVGIAVRRRRRRRRRAPAARTGTVRTAGPTGRPATRLDPGQLAERAGRRVEHEQHAGAERRAGGGEAGARDRDVRSRPQPAAVVAADDDGRRRRRRRRAARCRAACRAGSRRRPGGPTAPPTVSSVGARLASACRSRRSRGPRCGGARRSARTSRRSTPGSRCSVVCERRPGGSAGPPASTRSRVRASPPTNSDR